MQLFLKSFGLLIVLAVFSAWAIYLNLRYPLPGQRDESFKDWVKRFCETYQGAPCRQTKLVFWICVVGTIAAHTANFLIHH